MAQNNMRKVNRRTGYADAFDANAARKLSAAPKKQEQRRPQKRDNLVRLTEKELRKARRQNLNPLRAFASVLCVAVVFTLVCTMIYGQVELTELTEKINVTQTNLAQLESVETQLQMKATSNMNVDDIKIFAKDELGMEKIKSGQVTYVNLAQQDTGTVVEETKGNVFQQVWGALCSWLS